jgi:hypothetical protein
MNQLTYSDEEVLKKLMLIWKTTPEDKEFSSFLDFIKIK